MTTDNTLHVVLGAGPSGLAVLEALHARGLPARLVSRSGRAAVPAGVQTAAANLTDPAAARQAMAGAAVVYNCVGLPYPDWAAQWPPLLDSVIAGAAASGARLVMFDNVYAYGSTGGQPINEDTPRRPHTRKGRLRLAMLDTLLAAHAQGRVSVVVGQASDFFGPCATAQSHLGERVIPPALAGKAAQLLGNPDLPHALSFVLDIGRALVALGERESAYGQVWLLPHAPAMTMRQVVELVYAEVGGTPRMSTVPPLMLRLLGLVNPLIREMQEMLYQFEEPFIVDSGKFEAAFGMTATPLPEAVRATVAWFRAR